jgi:hypothetical protein
VSSWNSDALAAIAAADDLYISPLRDDGTTYGTPTWIWSVVVDADLYVRAYNGTSSRWYQSAMSQQAGRIRVAGGEYEVIFEPADPTVNDAVDAAYEKKYSGSRYLPPMVATKSRAATVRITPRT